MSEFGKSTTVTQEVQNESNVSQVDQDYLRLANDPNNPELEDTGAPSTTISEQSSANRDLFQTETEQTHKAEPSSSIEKPQFSHTLKDGTLVEARSLNELVKKCPFFGKIALQENGLKKVEAMARMVEKGRMREEAMKARLAKEESQPQRTEKNEATTEKNASPKQEDSLPRNASSEIVEATINRSEEDKPDKTNAIEQLQIYKQHVQDKIYRDLIYTLDREEIVNEPVIDRQEEPKQNSSLKVKKEPTVTEVVQPDVRASTNATEPSFVIEKSMPEISEEVILEPNKPLEEELVQIHLIDETDLMGEIQIDHEQSVAPATVAVEQVIVEDAETVISLSEDEESLAEVVPLIIDRQEFTLEPEQIYDNFKDTIESIAYLEEDVSSAPAALKTTELPLPLIGLSKKVNFSLQEIDTETEVTIKSLIVDIATTLDLIEVTEEKDRPKSEEKLELLCLELFDELNLEPSEDEVKELVSMLSSSEFIVSLKQTNEYLDLEHNGTREVKSGLYSLTSTLVDASKQIEVLLGKLVLFYVNKLSLAEAA